MGPRIVLFLYPLGTPESQDCSAVRLLIMVKFVQVIKVIWIIVDHYP